MNFTNQHALALQTQVAERKDRLQATKAPTFDVGCPFETSPHREVVATDAFKGGVCGVHAMSHD